MRGVGEARGAITFVNALFTGVGAAAAVDLPVRAEVDIRAGRASGPLEIDVRSENDTPLVRTSVEAATATFLKGRGGHVKLSISSEVPQGRGLKSSSAVSGAIIQAIARAGRLKPPLDEVARLSADVSLRAGVSATGAYDDALASLSGGFVVTDNRQRKTLRREAPALSGKVLLWMPPGEHAPAPSWLEAFSVRSAEATPAVHAAIAGRWVEAMEINSGLVESVMNYDYAPLRGWLRGEGAFACGVSGLGPTLAILAPGDRIGRIEEALAAREGRLLITEFPRGAGPVAGRGG